MVNKRYVPSLTALIVIAVAGCKGKDYETANDMTMRHMDLTRAQYGEQFVYMGDNAILKDMSVADIHFIAHTSEISGVGQVRLDRMAHLLNTYGGTVRYETDLADEDLLAQRIDHVREYLTLVGVDMNRVEVKPMLSGGRGLSGDEAIEHHGRGTARPSSGRGTQSFTLPVASSGS